MSQREKQRNPVCRRKSGKRKLKFDEEGNASLLSQKRSRKPPFNAVKVTNAIRSRSAVPRFRAGRQSRPCCARAHSEKPPDRPKNKLVCFSAGLRFFFCQEARMAACKLQAKIVCYCVQAGSPTGFFAAFFPGKKARILPGRFQNSALPVVRGKGSTSRMLLTPVRYMIRRSKPRPKPLWGALPYLRSSRYHQ